MSSEDPQTLFSLELLVENIRIHDQCKVSDSLALGLRLLDFPTLLIYQPPQSRGSIAQDEPGQHTFNRGKSCFFKMNLASLHVQLSNTPLYAMVLDVKEDTPRLVGSSLISLAAAMDRIRQEVSDRGVSSPSSHRERGVVGVCDLTGQRIGSISLRYKLLCLGASLLPHITERSGLRRTGEPGGPEPTQSLPLHSGDIFSPTLEKSDFNREILNNEPGDPEVLVNEDKQDADDDADAVCGSEEDLTVFCPPHLYYSNSAEENSNSKGGGGDYKVLNLDSEVLPFEDSCSENEEDEVRRPSSPVMHHKVPQRLSNQETGGVTPDVLREAVRQMPLLNALLVELSQLNDQNPPQSLTVHPSIAWIYRPGSIGPSAECGDTKSQHRSVQKTGHFHAPRFCSTPTVRPASGQVKDRQEQDLTGSKSSSKSPQNKKKTLMFGTTKTFNLRLKQASSVRVKRRECAELKQNETQSSLSKAKTKSRDKSMKSTKRKPVLNHSSKLSENIETVIQGVTAESAQQGTVTVKKKKQHQEVHGKQDGDSHKLSQKPSVSQRDLKWIHIPSVEGGSREKSEHHTADQSQSESDGERGTSSESSSKSSCSDSSRDRDEEADYADDFNSLGPSDAFSPDPVSSPEPSRTKTPKSPVSLDLCCSDSESVRRRAALLPVPVKAPSSPQRTLRGTHIIRPRTHTSALSFSSDDGSLKTVSSVKQRAVSSSGAESFISSRGQSCESVRRSVPVRGVSAESMSSFEPQEAEELEDELGSLDFRKEYQHISQLVANKLPGYTM